jgi:hypothetical protein
MSISKIKTGSITTDAITEAKVADGAIENEHLNSNVITGQTELSAAAATDDVLLVYDTSAGVIKKIAASNVGLQQPAISSISPTNLISGDGTGNYTITITGTGFITDATAKLVTDGGTDIAFDSVTRNSSTQLTCVIAKNTANLTNANEPFDVVVTTAGALSATSADAITIDASPAFVTSSGSLGSGDGNASLSFSVNATDPESAGDVTFELQSGSLPPGLSLTNTAAEGGTAIISGTATNPVANTTYNFTLRAVDAASNTTSRSFSITINRLFTSQSFTSSGTFSVPSGVTSISEVLVVAGGGPGASEHGSTGVGGGGAGGLIFMPEYPVSPGGTITVTVGEGGDSHRGSCGSPQGCKGQPSSFGSPGDPGLAAGGVLLAQGGAHGNEGTEIPFPGCVNGGSGGGGGYCRGGGTGTQPTQPGNSGAYGFGNDGGQGGLAGGGLSGGGGGGGAGANGASSGSTGDAAGGGPGGDGRAYTIADGTTPVYYAGGGGGSAAPAAPAPGGTGGQGGGTAGSRCSPSSNAGANKGGGSGGVRSSNVAGAGGKGVVIVRY